jgi:hypothetical protein
MGATYTRQSSAGIVDGGVIEASDLNDEFDQLLAAFVAASGHTHDGTAAEGGGVTKLLGTSITIGDATAGTDITVTFDGESNNGVLTWMEDEDLFKFTDTINVGVDDAGHDVKFFGDTASRYWLWDTSADGVVQLGTLTVGVDDAGYDVKFFGNTASAYMLWDTSADDLVLAGAAGIDLAGDIDVDGTANLDNTDIDGTLAVDGTTISLDATTSLNIDNSNTSNGITLGTATSGVPISIGHTVSETTINDNLTVTGTLTGTLATAAQGSVTSLGTLTALTVDDIALNGKVVTMTGSASDTVVLTAGTNGTLDITTTDAAAAAANIQITADGTVDIDSAGVLTLDSGAAINIEPASGSAILLDGTISVDAGVVTGATSITSTAFVGTLSTAAQANVTSLGTLTTLTVDNVIVNGTTIGHTSDTDLLTLADAALTAKGTITVGVDDTGHDVKFFGASAGAYLEWDESADQLRIMGASADATTSTGKLLLATSLTDINANDVIGKIEFQAPHEAGGTDAITVAAGIQAIAQGTFSASVNATDLIFYTGHSEAATEKFRFTSEGEIGIGGTNYGTDGQVLTSGGAGAAPAWEDASVGTVTAINNQAESRLVSLGSTTTQLDGEANLTFTGSALTCIGTVTVGVDNTGHDVKFFGATSGSYWLWDEDADGVVQIGTLTVGVDDAGHDVKFFGNAASAYMLWDTSADDLILAGGAGLIVPDGQFTLGSTAVTSTAAELNLLDTASANSVVNSKAVIYGGSGELAGTLSTAAQTNVTSLGTLTALTVDDVAINGKVVTMTGSTDDTAVLTVATNGALSLVTTDTAAAAANIQITADGTAELAGTTVTLDSAADIELEATDDINIPSNVGLTFGNDGEKIEGDGSDLTISGNTVNLDSSMNHTFSSTGKAMVLGF